MHSRKVLAQCLYHFSNFKAPGTVGITFPQLPKFKYLHFSKTSISSRGVLTKAKMQTDALNDGAMEAGVTVIRYQPGDDRFQMQLTLKTGKVFNFDRSVSDPVSGVVTRIVTNLSKKIKKGFGGNVKFLSEDSKEVENDEDYKMEKLLDAAFKSSSLKLQVDEDIYEIVMNPPEVYTVKFLSTYMPNCPLFPYKIETSSNFDKCASQYKWEYSRDKPKITPQQSKKKQNLETSPVPDQPVWRECGSKFICTPDADMAGGYLRFSCFPSDGKAFGKRFLTELPNPISTCPVDKFIYEERLARLSPKSADKKVLRVVSYNVLADCYATPEWFISSPKDSLDVGYRLPLLNKEIAAYEGDLVCLQEVDDRYFEGNFEPYLSTIGYKGRHTCKTGSTKEGIATFHNTNKLTELEFTPIVILEEMKRLPLWEKLKKVGDEFIARMEDRNTVFQISTFKVNASEKETILVVGNVHLYFHPDADHVRLLQTITCISVLERHVAQLKLNHPDKNVAVLFCGDLNCTPPFSSYRLLTTGQVLEEDEDWTSHPEEKLSPGLNVRLSLKLTNSHPGEELTNITTCFEGCLDYILYQEEHFNLLATCPPPDKEKLAVLTNIDEARKVSLPNFYTPSDHLPLIADLQLKS